MSVHPLKIVSINLNKQGALLHMLLQTSDVDVLLIQEPWHGTISINCSDMDPLGHHVLGVTANNHYQIYYPTHQPGERCLVVMYVKTQIDRSVSVINHLTHPMATASSMVVDIVTGNEAIHLINVYHQISREENGHHSIPHILLSELDQSIPTLFIGDLNTHSIYWSLPHSHPSPWADELIDWFDDQGLHLQNSDRVPTWHSNCDDDSLRLSIIDLTLINPATIFSDQFSDLSVSFNNSLSSDHAELSIYWFPETSIALAPQEVLPGFAVDDQGHDSWAKHFGLSFPPSIYDVPSLILVANSLHTDIDAASASIFPRRKSPHPQGARWWNPTYDAALTCIRLVAKGCEWKRAMRELHNVISKAKQTWAHEFLNHTTLTNLWEAAHWCKGHSVSQIPPIQTITGLSSEPADMATTFATCFFPPDPTPVPIHHLDDPTVPDSKT